MNSKQESVMFHESNKADLTVVTQNSSLNLKTISDTKEGSNNNSFCCLNTTMGNIDKCTEIPTVNSYSLRSNLNE